MSIAKEMVEAVMNGASPHDLLTNMFEADEIKPTSDYDTPEKAKAAVLAWHGIQKYGKKGMQKKQQSGKGAVSASKKLSN